MSNDTSDPPLKYMKTRILFLHVFDKLKLGFPLSLLSPTVIDFRFGKPRRVAKPVADRHQVTLLPLAVLASEHCSFILVYGQKRIVSDLV